MKLEVCETIKCQMVEFLTLVVYSEAYILEAYQIYTFKRQWFHLE